MLREREKKLLKYPWCAQMVEGAKRSRGRIIWRNTELSSVVNRAFTWDSTAQGDVYWEDIYRSLRQEERRR